MAENGTRKGPRRTGNGSRRWLTGLVAVATAMVLTVMLQQPAGAPPDSSANRSRAEQRPRNELQAEEAARVAREFAPVEGVQVAVRDGTAIVALQPRPGLSEAEHRRMEQDVAKQIPARVAGVNQALVTTDPYTYHRIRDLRAELRDAQRRVGPRLSESNPRYAAAFDDLLDAVDQLPNHARGWAWEGVR